ncbi:glutamine--fructose-6-phosphate transaminase (isomerizing) (plasmid) [Halobaculum sp. CBA1158]|uniref:glutamine--fructose-6-phosphate transaminase (isomerizing) n=1 Tax=Halobaculum sp. CBA1158 TaxID=2904243 RepID=UPI001F1AC825|nr:glutamine--fructose-6-phosphate transaminase (isomerizing) [Halobaculum sp. CBA1158]UIP01327.1 glutamine--fructose-6-phosphate transaminase (isomerizing) [Halobaculum sp. CBA1158]
MCGITACAGSDDVVDAVLTGLKNLEYRGYDSAGVATLTEEGIGVHKREGGIDRLVDVVDDSIAGRLGIGHTRWSTHGAPTDENAHPHTDCTGSVAVVHNGIIENYDELRGELSAAGHLFTSETDTEVVPHLIEAELAAGHEPEAAFRRAIDRLEGSYAIAALIDGTDAILATRRGSPLVLGVDGDRRFLASDVPSFLEFTSRVVYLHDGDVVRLATDGHEVTDADGDPVDRGIDTVDWGSEDAERDGYDHYMRKEISEQPDALERAVRGRIADDDRDVVLEDFPPGTFDGISEVHFLSCGTSHHASLYARQLLCDRGVPAHAFTAGEYATTPAPVSEETLVVAVTQSGETADTLASLRHADAAGARTLAVTNVVGSTAAREADDALFIRAGPEIGVAATKTFSSQVAVLALLVERLTEDVTGTPSDDREGMLSALRALPSHVGRVLEESTAASLAGRYGEADGRFFIGRGVAYPVAREGALKFKEITYEHAEGFAAGELKHGPLALVTRDTPVFAVFSGRHDTKTLNNVEEVRSRGAPVVAVASERNDRVLESVDECLAVPETHPDLLGVLANVQLQLVSYHVADLLDRSIDKPRNLAKSVTVE